jgi:hypothetical protein
MVMGKSNKVGQIGCGCAVFGVYNEVDWNTASGTDNGALIHGANNKVHSSHNSLIGGDGNTGCVWQGIVEGSGNKFSCVNGGFVFGSNIKSRNVN